MAEYLPPTETLPKFNEFVFEDAYSLEGLDRRVVHKAGTETITGSKTINSATFNVNTTGDTNIFSNSALNGIQMVAGGTIISANNLALTSNVGYATIDGKTDLYLQANSIDKVHITPTASTFTNNSHTMTTTTGTNTIENTGGLNLLDAKTTGTNTIKSANTSATANLIDATGAGGGNIIRANTGTNQMTTANATPTANLIDATTSGGGNTIRSVTGTNTIENTGGLNLLDAKTTGTNTIQSANTTPTANLIDATASGGGNTIRTITGQNLLTSTTGTNKIETANTSATANHILATGGGNNLIQTNSISSTTSNNILRTFLGSNIMEITNAGNLGGQNTIQSSQGTATPFGVYTAVNKIISLGTLASNELSSALGTNKLTSGLASATANVIEATAGGGNQMTTTTGENLLTTSTGINRLTSPNPGYIYCNVIEATGANAGNEISAVGGDNMISSFTGNNLFYNGTGINTMTTANTSAIANLIVARASGGGNTIRTTTGTNTMENTGGLNLLDAKTTGTNTIQSANTSATANLIDATGAGGGNIIRATTGTNQMTTANTGSTANVIDATGGGGGNTIRTTTGQNLLTSTTGTNKMTTANTSATANLIEATASGGGNKISTTTGQNLLTSTTGTTKITTANTSATGILLENTGTGGGITLSTTSGTGDISLTADSNGEVIITGGDITFNQAANGYLNIGAGRMVNLILYAYQDPGNNAGSATTYGNFGINIVLSGTDTYLCITPVALQILYITCNFDSDAANTGTGIIGFKKNSVAGANIATTTIAYATSATLATSFSSGLVVGATYAAGDKIGFSYQSFTATNEYNFMLWCQQI